MARPTYQSLVSDYVSLWETMEIKPSAQSAADNAANRIIKNRKRYEVVSALTRVPWYFIGLIHNRESSLDFNTHLHNGDPLTARTKQVPKGRPLADPANGKSYTWEESAVDALKQKKLHQIKDWTIDRMAYELENYNGWGYRNSSININSPYLWAKSNHYSRGKYVRDHVFSRNAVDQQMGTMVVLKCIFEKCPELNVEGDEVPSHKDIVKGSKTLSHLQRLRLFIRSLVVSVGALFTWDNVMQAKNLVVDNSGWILLGLGAVVLVSMEYTKWLETQSVKSAQNGEWKIIRSEKDA